ncbi:MAG: molybdopterin-binding/glycosyltransferase family 2 protein [Hyphomicrobiaceae bacterium]
MKFGPQPLDKAHGAILAHSVRLPGGAIKKGTRLDDSDIARLSESGLAEVVVAMLASDDVLEDDAATQVARILAGPGVDTADAATGRVNLYAACDGLVQFDRERLVALNLIDEGLTVATLRHGERVAKGRMIATIKIIPYALPGSVVEAALDLLGGDAPLLSMAAFTPHRAGLIISQTPDTKPSVVTKRGEVNGKRIMDLGSTLAAQTTVTHDTATVAQAISAMAAKDLDPILVFGASAIADREDVIPAAIAAAGGTVQHFGMPVDPGNLLLLGKLGKRTIIGVPSCASSPKLNGLDWVLERCLAGLETTHRDIAAMAPGGLLMEISSRPQPRETATPIEATSTPRITALVLAAGRSTRMGANNKLIEPVAGKPMVRHVVEAALASDAAHVRVVTGNKPVEVQHALDGLEVTYTHNPDFADGLSTSLAAGTASLEGDVDGAIVLLGDMPLVTAALINRLIAAFDPAAGRAICVPVHNGKRGNPILWAARFFGDMTKVQGDTGARHLIGENAEWLAEVDAGDVAIFRDIDTPEALAALRSEKGG